MGESVFISYSHVDKPIARRVARRLDAYGITTWLDERELRLGGKLSPAIQKQITNSTAVVVIATEAAAGSAWVKKEVDFASAVEPAISICPLLIDDVSAHPVFAQHLGLNARDSHQFERAIEKLAEAVVGNPNPTLSLERLRQDLKVLAQEEAALAPLIEGCLEGEGLRYEQIEAVAEAPFHSLDFAISALYDATAGTRRQRVIYVAAFLFRRKGVGTYALERYVSNEEDCESLLSVAVGVKLEPTEIDTALGLLARRPPHDQALSGFINSNGATLSSAQRGHAARLVTFPSRGPGGFAADSAFAALRLMPDSDDLKVLWQRWIRDGFFDDSRLSDTLARDLAQALTEGLMGWKPIVDEFLYHVRRLARSTDRSKVEMAVDHLKNAARRKSPLVAQIATQCESALGAAEWNDWADEEEMSIYVTAFVKAAHSDQDWNRAYEEYKKQWDNLQKYKAELDK